MLTFNGVELKRHEFLWKTTSTVETKSSLSKMYPAIPALLIKEAIVSGVRDFPTLMEMWKKHNVKTAISKAAAQKISVRTMRGWQLNIEVKQNFRHHKEYNE